MSPIDLPEFDISPLSLAATSPSVSPSGSSVSDLSLDDGDTTLINYDSDERGRSDFESDSTSSIDSCTDPTCCPPPPPAKPSPFSSNVVIVPDASFHPLVIVGAGPHSLALAARLSEPRPAALYTDLEHARLSWLQREQGQQRQESREKKHKKKTVKGHWAARKILDPETITLASQGVGEGGQRRGIKVLDSTSDRWLGRWHNYFEGLKIKTLRSPMLFHPSPADVDALVAYTRRMGRDAELTEINGVVGKELSKHQKKKRGTTKKVNGTVPINERDRQDYYRPSSRLFDSFVSEELISRYTLSGIVQQATVTSVTYGPVQTEGDSEPRLAFVIESRNPDGSTLITASKALVIAPGPSNQPNIPQVIKQALPISPSSSPSARGSPWRESDIKGENWCHSSAFALPGFSPVSKGSNLGNKVRRGAKTTIAVIGGGLTSIQIVDSLLNQGVDKVHLICRSHIKIKHFDFPLSWVSKYNNLEKAAFWNCPTHQERLGMIQSARAGGSVNPEFYKLLNQYIKSGKVELKTLSSINFANYSNQQGQGSWEIRGETFTNCRNRLELNLTEPTTWQLSGIDYLVSSTGSKLDLDTLPFLESIRREFPIQEVGGLPCLTEDLQWDRELPLFVMGAYSMLELGPDALNLSGCRTGAERVAHRLGELGIFETFRLRDREKKLGQRRGGEGRRQGENGQQEQVEELWERTRMEEKQYRSGGEGNFFRGLSVGVEA